MSIKNLLFIRPDNMGDLVMCTPAFKALKESFNCRITLLTSEMAKPITRFLPDVDEVITANLPWVKLLDKALNADIMLDLVALLKKRQFDTAVISTVYSQNSMPAAMLAWLAGIPVRIGYCRENPYDLLSHWIPDKEPLTNMCHQVEREMALVRRLGATTADDSLRLKMPEHSWEKLRGKLILAGISHTKPCIIFHAGVSEQKRQWPAEQWVELAQQLINTMGCQIIFTGSAQEQTLCRTLADATGMGSVAIAGSIDFTEFLTLIQNIRLVVTVNTVTSHLAAAVGTPVIVLYATTNPQHYPWKAKGHVFVFEPQAETRSNNEIIRFAHHQYSYLSPQASIEAITGAACDILICGEAPPIEPVMFAPSLLQPPPLLQAAEMYPAGATTLAARY